MALSTRFFGKSSTEKKVRILVVRRRKISGGPAVSRNDVGWPAQEVDFFTWRWLQERKRKSRSDGLVIVRSVPDGCQERYRIYGYYWLLFWRMMARFLGCCGLRRTPSSFVADVF